jgi:alpha-ribazole phosphatase
MMETTFTLIRHPKPSITGICYGSIDLPLSEEGLERARAIAEELAAEPFAAIYTSPLQRCAVAARMLAEGRDCPLVTFDALREIDFGRFEGHTFDDLAREYPDIYRRWMEDPTEVEFPGGESYAALRRRVLGAVGGLRARHPGQSIAVVTHGGVIRTLVAEAQGMDPRRMFEIEVTYGSIRRVTLPSDPDAPLAAPAATRPRPQ